MQSLFFSVSLASQSYGCQLGSEAADAAAFDWLAARHFSGRADTPTFVYVPDQMGGVGLALNRLCFWPTTMRRCTGGRLW